MNFLSILRTIRFRLTVGYLIVLFLSAIALSFYLHYQVKVDIDDEIVDLLGLQCEELAESISGNIGQMNLIVHDLNEKTKSSGLYKLYYELFDNSGAILAKSMDFAENTKDAVMLAQMINLPTGAEETELGVTSIAKGYTKSGLRTFTRPVFYNGELHCILQMGADLGFVEMLLYRYFKTIIFAIPIMIIVAAFCGYFLARHYLKPIADLNKKIQEITVRNLDGELPTRGNNDELDQLANNFNQLLHRLSISYQKIAQFSSDVSHELRIPITTLKGEAEVVLGRERDIEEYSKVLESSIEEFDRLTRMINDLLILSRSDFADEKLEIELIDLSSLLQNILEFLKPLADDKAIAFDVKIEKGIQVQANKVLLERLFSNLIDNAIKFTNTSAPIAISLSKQGEEVVVSIRDHGVGIPKESLGRVFDRFYRVDKSRSRDLGGAGLGLSISKMIVERHQGAIHIQSPENEGTEVTVSLPIAN